LGNIQAPAVNFTNNLRTVFPPNYKLKLQKAATIVRKSAYWLVKLRPVVNFIKIAEICANNLAPKKVQT
jgi:hypothetical protein